MADDLTDANWGGLVEDASERELSHLYKRIGELDADCRAHVEIRIEQERYIRELESVLPALPPTEWGTTVDHMDIGRLNYTHSGENLAVMSSGVRVCRTCKRRKDAQRRAYAQ